MFFSTPCRTHNISSTYQIVRVKVSAIIDALEVLFIVHDSHPFLSSGTVSIDCPALEVLLTLFCGLCKSVFNKITEYDNTKTASSDLIPANKLGTQYSFILVDRFENARGPAAKNDLANVSVIRAMGCASPGNLNDSKSSRSPSAIGFCQLSVSIL